MSQVTMSRRAWGGRKMSRSGKQVEAGNRHALAIKQGAIASTAAHGVSEQLNSSHLPFGAHNVSAPPT